MHAIPEAAADKLDHYLRCRVVHAFVNFLHGRRFAVREEVLQLLDLYPQVIPRLTRDCDHNVVVSVLLEVLSKTMASNWGPTGFYTYHPINSEESVALNPGIFSAFL